MQTVQCGSHDARRKSINNFTLHWATVMISKEITEICSLIRWRNNPAVEDFADRLSVLTAFFFLLVSVITPLNSTSLTPSTVTSL